jgi:hypothetical protein
MRRRGALLGAAVAVAAVAAGCGGGGGDRSSSEPATVAERPAPSGDVPRERRESPPRPPAPRCPVDASNCAAAAGRVVALESVDADGDGDLHVILFGGSVTLPGVSVLDVSAALRPRRDPRIGDWAAGAGPVYEGSYGQRQIEVVDVAFARR